MTRRQIRAQRQAKEQLRFLPDTEEEGEVDTSEEDFTLSNGERFNPRDGWPVEQVLKD